MTHVFMAGTSTGVGKTTVAAALLAAWQRAGRATLGIKPVETGVETAPADALMLARFSSHAADGTWYRHAMAASPHTVTLTDSTAAPSVSALAAQVNAARCGEPSTVVEGAGGFMVPIAPGETMADLAAALRWPVVLVGANRLGVQSDVLVNAEAIARRGLTLAAVVLNQVDRDDAPGLCNRAVLCAHLTCPVLAFPYVGQGQSASEQAADALVCALEEVLS